MSEFTPGPWRTDETHSEPTRGMVAFASELLIDRASICQYKARLIAAAHEMYAMLHEAGIKLERFATTGDKLDEEQRSALFTAKAIRALLTKIDGE
jgi:hypothetical protein